MAVQSALLVALAVAVVLYRFVIYPAFLSPLAKIPAAHPTASVSGLWFWWAERTDCQAASLLDAHRRKGPVVRVEPNHVHFASQDALRVIYHVGRFDRNEWWTQFRPYSGTPNMLTLLDAKPHATRRRIVSLVYSKSYILGSLDFQRLSHLVVFDRLLPVFDEAAAAGRAVDVLELNLAVAVEFMSLYEFGTATGLDIVRSGREKERKAYIDAGWTKVLERRGCQTATKFLEDHTLDMCRAADDFLASGTARPNDETADSTYPVVYAQLRDAIPKKEGAETPQQAMVLAAAELIDNMEAARVLAGVALTYLFYEITKHPATLAALRAELLALDPALRRPTGGAVPGSALRALDALPLLGAVVTETLRLRNPVRMPFRRVVPAGGAAVDGFRLPAGTTVSASNLPMHMNPDAFPDPERWDPGRWLGLPDAGGEGDAGGAEKGARAENDPRRWFWSFLSGSRMCIGNNFAQIRESPRPVVGRS
jgi:cytochrome P450